MDQKPCASGFSSFVFNIVYLVAGYKGLYSIQQNQLFCELTCMGLYRISFFFVPAILRKRGTEFQAF